MPPVSTFDPETAGASFDPEAAGAPVDVEGLGSPASASQQLQGLAPLAARPDASPADDKAYIEAYKQHYEENPRLHTLGHAILDSASHPLDTLGTIGHTLYNGAKGAYDFAGNILGGPEASTTQKAVNALKLSTKFALGDPTITKGIAAGGADTIYQMANVLGAGIEQTENLASDLYGGKEAKAVTREFAAQMALQRLKLGYKESALTSGPEQGQPGALEFQAGKVMGGVAGAMAIPGSGLAGDASKAGSDLLGAAAQKTAGLGAKMLPPAANLAEAGGIAHAAVTHPAITALALLTQKTPVASFWSKLGSVKSGFFARANYLGDRLLATPVGKGVIDDIIDNAPQALQKAYQDNITARAAVAKAEQIAKDADAMGLPSRSYTKAVNLAKKARDVADLRSSVIQEGVGYAQKLKDWGVAGIPSKVADATSGAILGAATGGAISAANAQPGDKKKIQAGIDAGAFYGGILSLLGTAGMAARAKATRGGSAPATTSATPPPLPQAPGIARQPPPLPNTPAPQGQIPPALPAPTAPAPAPAPVPPARAPAPGKPIQLPASTQEAAAGLQNKVEEIADKTFVVNGAPHDTAEFSRALKNVSKAYTNAARFGNPNETFNIPTTPAFGAGHDYPTIPSDQEILALKNQWQTPPPNKEGKVSSVFTKMAYDAKQGAWSAEYKVPGHRETYHYYGADMTPDEWGEWMKSDSLGAHFNKVIKPKFPVLRVHDGADAAQVAKEISRARGFSDWKDH